MQKPVSRAWIWSGLVLAFVALVFFVFFTPPSLLRKADYIGAAVCHRLPEHSFFVDEHQLPVCQRCTGTFAGALTGILVHWLILRRRRAQRFPRPWVWALVGLSFLVWALDGVNSTLATTTGPVSLGELTLAALYEPRPWLRLLTGTLMGMSMSIVLVPAFNQTVWRDGVSEPTLRSWGDLSPLLAVELAQAAIIFLQPDWLLYPIALYSALGVVAMFVLLGAMMWTMALNREQAYGSWQELWLPLVWGLVFAALVIGTMDGMRLLLTGTLDGVPGLGSIPLSLSDIF
ncbi:MAG: DUF2085 domain-containing protein [Anaerolineales bacterium]